MLWPLPKWWISGLENLISAYTGVPSLKWKMVIHFVKIEMHPCSILQQFPIMVQIAYYRAYTKDVSNWHDMLQSTFQAIIKFEWQHLSLTRKLFTSWSLAHLLFLLSIRTSFPRQLFLRLMDESEKSYSYEQNHFLPNTKDKTQRWLFYKMMGKNALTIKTKVKF